MKIIVCVKQVPDTDEVRIDPKTNTLIREGVPLTINPLDEYALEAALRIKDAVGAEVIAISMGPHSRCRHPQNRRRGPGGLRRPFF